MPEARDPVDVVRLPDGRVVVPIVWHGEDVLLDVGTAPHDATAAARAFLFVKDGEAPEPTTWRVMPFALYAHQRVVSIDAVVRMNVDFVQFLRARAREEAERYARIPGRRRRAA